MSCQRCAIIIGASAYVTPKTKKKISSVLLLQAKTSSISNHFSSTLLLASFANSDLLTRISFRHLYVSPNV